MALRAAAVRRPGAENRRPEKTWERIAFTTSSRTGCARFSSSRRLTTRSSSRRTDGSAISFTTSFERSTSPLPRVHQASSGKEALKRLAGAYFDLVVVMSSLADQSVNEFAHSVRRLYPKKPIVYLALDARELEDLEDVLDREVVDSTYLWTGDSSVLLGLIKLVEDRANADPDTASGVRTILVLEDSPTHYSNFIGLLYEELMKQAKSLYLEGLNELQRKLFTRSRPKILHAVSYEEGLGLYERYGSYLLGLICDVRLPLRGGPRRRSRVQVRPARPARPSGPARALPLGREANEEKRGEHSEVSSSARRRGHGVRSARLPRRAPRVRRLHLPTSRRYRGRARHGRGGAAAPHRRGAAHSIEHHASRDDFSIWLMARSEFDLAETLRPQKITDFDSIEDLRRHLSSNLQDALLRSKSGIVTEFRRKRVAQDHFSSVGDGSLGAKARGLAFLHQRFSMIESPPRGTLPIRVPKTVVLTTELFDAFVDDELVSWAVDCEDDDAIIERFTTRPLPQGLAGDIEAIVKAFPGPLAVRSSGLLEDSSHQPFAGIYATLMIPNSSTSATRRREALARAIRLVYASTFSCEACAYRERSGAPAEREKMAVMIQSVVGARHGERFYPTVSGVGLTRNFYPIAPQRPEHGVVHLALGLGRMIVDGGLSIRFSPRHPEVLPQIATPRSALRSTQRNFYGIDLATDGSVNPMDAVRNYDLSDAEHDGTLALVGSVYSNADERLIEDLSLAEIQTSSTSSPGGDPVGTGQSRQR